MVGVIGFQLVLYVKSHRMFDHNHVHNIVNLKTGKISFSLFTELIEAISPTLNSFLWSFRELKINYQLSAFSQRYTYLSLPNMSSSFPDLWSFLIDMRKKYYKYRKISLYSRRSPCIVPKVYQHAVANSK